MDIEFEKYDDCCFIVIIKENGKEIECGIWCSVSHRLAIGGELVDYFSTQDEIRRDLKKVETVRIQFVRGLPSPDDCKSDND